MEGKKGTYSEPLASGGSLIVTSKGWRIMYHLPGLDARHSGSILTVESDDIDNYINAFKNNFQKYCSLKDSLPADEGTFRTTGECGMIIVASQSNGGVFIAKTINTLHSTCFPISNEDSLNKVIADYEYCKQRAEEIRSKLFAD